MLEGLFLSYLILLSSVSWPVANAQLNPTFWTSQVPLALRSPYVNSWLNTNNVPLQGTNKRAPELWPLFWNNVSSLPSLPHLWKFATHPYAVKAILGWAGHVRIDNNNASVWKWLGDSGTPGGLNNTVLNNLQVTPTRTIMSITAGPIDLTVTYLSPIEVRSCFDATDPPSLILVVASRPREAIAPTLLHFLDSCLERRAVAFSTGVH